MKLKPFYDDKSFDYEKYWEKRAYENKSDKMALAKLLKLIPKGGHCLDLGVGFGRLTPVYSQHFDHQTLMDPSKKMLGIARRRVKKEGTIFKQGFAEKIPAKNNSFDAVFMIRTLHHIKNPELVFAEIHRVLKPGGYFILEFANKSHFKTRLKAYFFPPLRRLLDLKPLKIGTCNQQGIPFINYHPTHILTALEKSGFHITRRLSVSNLRNSMFKRFIPINILLYLEDIMQEARSATYFGPSIFVLSQKK